MWKAEKGFALKYASVLGTAVPLVGAGKERRHPHILPFSGLLLGMPYQAWGPAQALDSTFLSSSYWYYPRAVCCHVCSEDMLTIFVSP